MKITRDNYEAWFIDHIEGKLSLSQEKELKIFLREHPELREELDAFELVTLEKDATKYLEKNDLKKRITAENRDELLVGYIEGDLSDPELKLVEENLKTADIAADLELYRRTILAGESCIFPDKHRLYRSKSLIRPIYYRLAAAAGILLLFSLLLFQGENDKRGMTLVQKKHEIPTLNSQPQISVVQPSIINHPSSTINHQPSTINHQVPTSSLLSYTLVTIDPITLEIQNYDIENIVPESEQQHTGHTFYNPDEVPSDPSLGEFLTYKVKDRMYSNTDEDPVRGKLRWYEVVNVIGKGLSSLTGKPFKMNKTLDEEGKLMAYRIDYGNYTLEKELNP